MPRKPAFRLGRSRTGLGLFATAPIKKRAFIVEYKGRKLTTEQADVLEARGNRYLYEINSRWTIDGTTRRNLGRYANHSCRPNAKARTVGHRVFLRAIKNIKPGDEITYNYGRDYFLNVIKPRGCKCDKCRAKRAAAQAKARAKHEQANTSQDRAKSRVKARAKTTGRKAPDLSAGSPRPVRPGADDPRIHRVVKCARYVVREFRDARELDGQTLACAASVDLPHQRSSIHCETQNENPPRISPGGPTSSAPSQLPVHPRSAALSRATVRNIGCRS